MVHDAAVEAELETGVREETVADAEASILRRLARITAGFFVVFLGLILIPLPGPGWLVVASGLVILSRDFVWAERTLNVVRKRIPQTSDGKIHPRTWMVAGAMTTLTLSASLWWTLLR